MKEQLKSYKNKLEILKKSIKDTEHAIMTLENKKLSQCIECGSKSINITVACRNNGPFLMDICFDCFKKKYKIIGYLVEKNGI